eukprot:1101738-Rhodomonas_salina.2
MTHSVIITLKIRLVGHVLQAGSDSSATKTLIRARQSRDQHAPSMSLSKPSTSPGVESTLKPANPEPLNLKPYFPHTYTLT